MTSAGAPDRNGWRKSSYSNGEGGACLEVADGVPGLVLVRDSKRATGPVLNVPAADWTAFARAVKAGALAR